GYTGYGARFYPERNRYVENHHRRDRSETTVRCLPDSGGDVLRPRCRRSYTSMKSSTIPTTTSTLEAALRRDLILGVLPAGAKLRVRELSERYQVGAIPVREALSRLCNSGFVEAVDQRGFRVSGVSLEELKDITRTRQQLESIALREAISRADPDWEASV